MILFIKSSIQSLMKFNENKLFSIEEKEQQALQMLEYYYTIYNHNFCVAILWRSFDIITKKYLNILSLRAWPSVLEVYFSPAASLQGDCGSSPLLSHKFYNIKKVMAQKFSTPSFPRGFSGNPAVYLTLKTFKTKLGCWLDTR